MYPGHSWNNFIRKNVTYCSIMSQNSVRQLHMYKQWSLSSCKDERFFNLQWAFLPQCHLNIQSYLSFKQWLQVWHTSLLKYFRLTIWFNKRSLTETHCGRAGKRPRGTSGLDPPVWRLPAANARRILTLRNDVVKARIWILMYPGNLNRW